jgi:1-aminocyclopropane-1-carboxylate deaminase/D-cysteine desulfhydrase-like pyridoxal-dependent ACC family enzyme
VDDADWPPRFPLIDAPSPLHRLHRLTAALGGRAEIWIKREDMLPLGLGGNKLRNLEYLVGTALEENADTLVTVGRRWSNHARLTAAAGSRAGLAVHLVLSGPPDAAARSPNVRLCELLGATVHVAASDQRSDRTELADRVVAEVTDAGRRPFVIGVGGSGVTGALGQVMAAREFHDQAGTTRVADPIVVLPSATGGTQAGVLGGLRERGSQAAVVGFAVAQPVDELRPAIADLLAGLEPFTGTTVDPAEIELDPSQLGDGYGVPSKSAEEAARLLARTEGILVDPIYTAKALAGLIDRVFSGAFDGRQVVFWHAGGLPGLFEPLDDPP